jgi:hypothetical protein
MTPQNQTLSDPAPEPTHPCCLPGAGLKDAGHGRIPRRRRYGTGQNECHPAPPVERYTLPRAHGALTDPGPPGSSSPVRQMLLHFELGIAVLVADPLDVEEFL